MKLITQNKKAYFDYEILDTIETGIVLTGDEVKSIRAGHVSLVGAFATVHDGELFVINMQITPYEKAYQVAKGQERRSRKLLVHRRELARLIGDISAKGVTLVALKLYFSEKSKIKLSIGIAKHKKAVDKKASLRERDIRRETSRELKNMRD